MPIYINGVPYRNLEDQVKYLTEGYNDLSLIKTYVPVDASATNQLASKSYVDQSVTTVAAHYLTSDASGNNFPTKAALLAGPYYYGAELHDPDENDYAFVNADESHSNLPSRYAYINDAWQYQYSLQASGGVVDLTSAQTITGVKTFSNGIKITPYTSISKANDYQIKIGGDLVIDGAAIPFDDATYNFGGQYNRWKELYLSGKINLYNSTSDTTSTIRTSEYGELAFGPYGTDRFYFVWDSFHPSVDNAVDLGDSNHKFKDLYISGNIVGAYKEANQVVKSGTLNTGRFQMTADEVNKIKYIEIYVDTVGGDSSSMMIPVAAWNMSQWTSNHEINTNGLSFDTINVMYNNGNLYVALDAMNSGHTVQFFAKMI